MNESSEKGCVTNMLFTVVTIVGLIIVTFLVLVRVYVRLTTSWCTSKTDLTGKTALVTGADSGIGFFTALDFARRNARVILVCRNQERGEAALERIKEATGNQNVVLYLCDLSLMKSVRDLAETVLKNESRLDILVNNAGLLTVERTITEEGKEMIYASNHFGPFFLTNLLLDLLKKSKPSRIVNVSSEAHGLQEPELDDLKAEKKFHGFHRYCHSKLFNVLFTRELAQRLEGTGVTTYSLHPGHVATEIWKLGWKRSIITDVLIKVFKCIMKTSEEGAQTSIHCAVSEGIEKLSGKYFDECREAEHKSSKASKDMGLAKKIWEISKRETGLVDN